jgi:hypothetical protein
MKYFFLLFTISLAISCNNSKRGSGNIITENRKLDGFDGVTAAGPVKVDIQMGATGSVIVETDDNIMPFVETNISNSILKIRLKSIDNLRNSTVYVHIITPQIKNLTTSASAEIASNDEIKAAEKLILKASSGSSIDVKVDAPFINGEASSGSEINCKGRTKQATVSSSSGSTINFSDLQAETAKATVSSGANISLFASISIVASASSGGAINYKGGATSVQKNVSSGGSVNAQ